MNASKKTIFMITATASMLFASCGNNAKTETDAAAAPVEDVQAAETAAEPEAEASIVGAWKLSDIDLGMEVPKGKEKVMEEMKAKMIAETVYTFNEDGTMTFKNPMVKETAGTYTYEDSKLVITDNTTKKAETVTVESLTADKLVIASEQGGKKLVMTFSK